MKSIQTAIKNCGNSDVSISNQGLRALRAELDKRPNANSLITKSWLWSEEPALSFSISKVINEVCAVFVPGNGMHLNGTFSAYKKMAALLMVYDYCKTNAAPLLLQEFDKIVHAQLDAKLGDERVQSTKEQIAGFISKLVENSVYNEVTGEWIISLHDYAISEESGSYFMHPAEGADASFIVNTHDASISISETHHYPKAASDLPKDDAPAFAAAAASSSMQQQEGSDESNPLPLDETGLGISGGSFEPNEPES